MFAERERMRRLLYICCLGGERWAVWEEVGRNE